MPKGDRLLLAVSGGQDSLCLAQLLLDLQPKWGWTLGVAHCDHGWREDSRANAEYVETLTKRWQMPFYLKAASHQALKNEAQARQWRYEALKAIADEHEYCTIVTGHTQSDLAETFLFHAIRGTGADGLQAIAWERLLEGGIRLVRPLLGVSRWETEAFCHQASIEVWEDATNRDLKYSRNRIRQELLPYLQTHFNSRVEQHLARTAELLRADVEFLQAEAQRLLESSISQTDEKVKFSGEKEGRAVEAVRLNRRILSAASLGIQRRAMRQLLQQLLPSAPTFDHVEKLTQLINAPNRSRTDPFPGGAIARVEGHWIVIN